MSEDKPRKTRKPRRNHAKELADIQAFCKLFVEILEGDGSTESDFQKGRIAAFRAVLERLEGKNG